MGGLTIPSVGEVQCMDIFWNYTLGHNSVCQDVHSAKQNILMYM